MVGGILEISWEREERQVKPLLTLRERTLEPLRHQGSPPTLPRIWTSQSIRSGYANSQPEWKRELKVFRGLDHHHHHHRNDNTSFTMAASRYCPSCLTKASPTTLFRTARPVAPPPSFLRPFHTSSPLAAGQSQNAAKYKRKDAPAKKKKKASTSYSTPDLRDALQFSLVDAMRYANTRKKSLQGPMFKC